MKHFYKDLCIIHIHIKQCDITISFIYFSYTVVQGIRKVPT